MVLLRFAILLHAIEFVMLHGKLVIPEKEVEGLFSIYNNTNGAYWIKPWNVTLISSQPCDLLGITCSPIINNQTYAKISSISLTNRNLTGSLDYHIGNFDELLSLEIAYNFALTSTIPPEICSLKKLKQMNLQNLSITGPLPFCFPILNQLDIKSVSFSGTLSQSICNLTLLEHVRIWNTSIEGSIPTCVSNLKNMRKFELKWNLKMFGTIPLGVCEWKQLTDFHLQYMNQYGTVPQCIWSKVGLGSLELNGNKFTGTISSISSSISKFEISENSLEGILPAIAVNASLSEFVVHKNQFHGDITAVFPNLNVLKNVKGFTIFNNDFDGDITEILRYLFLNSSDNLG
eukprot:324928_1